MHIPVARPCEAQVMPNQKSPFLLRSFNAVVLLMATSFPACTTSPLPEGSPGVTARLVGGLGYLLDTDLRGTGPGATADGSASFDAGWQAGGAVGYRFNDTWSADIEMMYRNNEIDQVASSSPAIDGGDFASLALMTNVRYYLPIGGPLRTYVGLGVGWLEEIDIDLASGGSENGFSTSGFGAQALLGAEYPLTDRLWVDLEGRYFRSFAGKFEGEEGASGRYDADYDRVEMFVGLTWRF
jgi:opacity protein-like surface antigen